MKKIVVIGLLVFFVVCVFGEYIIDVKIESYCEEYLVVVVEQFVIFEYGVVDGIFEQNVE